ncbi:MAG: HK97 family phage prohead protease [Planctomycetota bacterium]
MSKSNGLYLDQAHRLLNPFRRDLEPTRGDKGFARFKVRGVDKKRRTVTAAVSTSNRDRHGEVVMAEAVEASIPRFMENPVMLAGHEHVGVSGEPTTIGHWIDMHRDGDTIIGTARFLDNDELAEKYWQRYLQRAQRAFSIGFMGLGFKMLTVDLGNGPERVRHWTELELIEISAVAVPSNRESLARNAMATVDAALTLGDGDAGGLGEMSNRRLNKTLARAIPSSIKEQLEEAIRDIGYKLDPDECCELGFLIERTAERTALALANALIDRLNGANSSRAKGAPSQVAHLRDCDFDIDTVPDDDPFMLDYLGHGRGGDGSVQRSADDLDALLSG